MSMRETFRIARTASASDRYGTPLQCTIIMMLENICKRRSMLVPKYSCRLEICIAITAMILALNVSLANLNDWQEHLFYTYSVFLQEIYTTNSWQRLE